MQVFDCQHCHQPFQVSAEHAGKPVRCPSCAKPNLIPAAETQSGATTNLLFACPSCSGQFQVPLSMNQQTVACPHCSTPVLVQADASKQPGSDDTPAINTKIKRRASKSKPKGHRGENFVPPAQDLFAPGFKDRPVEAEPLDSTRKTESAKKEPAGKKTAKKEPAKKEPVDRERPQKKSATLKASPSKSVKPAELKPDAEQRGAQKKVAVNESPADKTKHPAKKSPARPKSPPHKGTSKKLPIPSVAVDGKTVATAVSKRVASSKSTSSKSASSKSASPKSAPLKIDGKASAQPSKLQPPTPSQPPTPLQRPVEPKADPAVSAKPDSAKSDVALASPTDADDVAAVVSQVESIAHLLPPTFDVHDPERLHVAVSQDDNKVILPDADGGTTRIDKRIVHIDHGGEKVSLIVLSPEQRERRRMIQNLVVIGIGVALIAATIWMLVN